MKKIGIFYAAKADKTSWVAEKIQKEFGTSAESVAIENAWQNDFEAYDNFIVGASTWFDGELPTYWDRIAFFKQYFHHFSGNGRRDLRTDLSSIHLEKYVVLIDHVTYLHRP